MLLTVIVYGNDWKLLASEDVEFPVVPRKGEFFELTEDLCGIVFDEPQYGFHEGKPMALIKIQ